MLRVLLRFALPALLLFVAPFALAAAQGEEHHGLDPTTLGLQILNVAALVFILVKFAGKAINRSLQSRHDQLKKDLEEAAQARSTAEARLKEQERRLGNLEQEIARLRASIKEEAEREQARLLAAAEEKAQRIQDEARFLMEQQIKEAELRFRDEVASTALQVAEEMVRRSFSPQDESRLVSGFISDLERTPQESRV
jgi:F-type H+-transporting ATPase subunit b